MRSRLLCGSAVVASAIAIGSAFLAPSASSSTAVGGGHPSGVKHVCFRLVTNHTLRAILSQNFTDAGMSAFDSAGAASFTLDHTCVIKTIRTVGRYIQGSGPADSVDVTFYADDKGVPGDQLFTLAGQPYKDPFGEGHLRVDFSGAALPAGSYWVSVVANMSFADGGEWRWKVSSDQDGPADMWENPGGGFGVCSTWGINVDCTGTAGDYVVTLGS